MQKYILEGKCFVTTDGDLPFWGSVMSSGYSETYKRVFGSKNPRVNVTLEYFYRVKTWNSSCWGTLLLGCSLFNIGSRLICVASTIVPGSLSDLSFKTCMTHEEPYSLFCTMKLIPAATCGYFLYLGLSPFDCIPKAVILFLIPHFPCLPRASWGHAVRQGEVSVLLSAPHVPMVSPSLLMVTAVSSVA